ncbi:MAG: GNAT family N-acetyltransferase [Anaerolineaceae bacterium]|nr:GNAT family N-acetyltransferase [Anaerolineaceae bacterium]
MLIRPPTFQDASALAHIHVETWRSQYRGIVAQEILDGLDEKDSQTRWESAISNRVPPDSFVLVAEEAQQVVGFVSGGPIREPIEGFTAELYAIYILPSAQKKHIGKQLVREFTLELQRRNFHDLVVWVLEANSSRAFYERLGGKLLGRKVIEGGRANGLAEVSYGWDDISILAVE